MFTTIFMNNNDLEKILGHLEWKSGVWVELKDQSCMKTNNVVIFWSIKSLRSWGGYKCPNELKYMFLNSRLFEDQSHQFFKRLWHHFPMWKKKLGKISEKYKNIERAKRHYGKIKSGLHYPIALCYFSQWCHHVE